MKQIIYTIVLLFSLQLLYSQSVQVSLKGDWEDGLKMKLYGYYGVEKYLMDSSATFSLKVNIPDSLRRAVFELYIFKGKSRLYSRPLLYNGRPVVLELYLQDDRLDVRWRQSGLNSLFEKYENEKDSLENRLQVLLGLYNTAPDTTSSFYGKLYNEIVRNGKDLENLFLDFWGEHKGDVLGDYIRNDYYDLPDFSKGNLAEFMKVHYFDYFDPLDTLVVHSPLFRSKLEDYLGLAEGLAAQKDGEINQEILMSALDDYLNLTAGNDAIQAATLQALWQKYHYKSMDGITKYLDEEWISTQCHAENDATLQERLESYKRLKKGNKAPDFEFQAMRLNKEGTYHLADFKGKRIILVFWASWCPHCEQMLPVVKKYTDKLENTVVVAVGLDDNRKPWLTAIQRYPGWYHIQAKEKWESPWAKAYSIYATPTFYVIDAAGRLLGKANNESELRKLTAH